MADTAIEAWPAGMKTGDLARQVAGPLGLSFTDARLAVLLWRGLTNEAIAEHLGVRVGTVKSRLFRLYRHMKIHTRAMAVRLVTEALTWEPKQEPRLELRWTCAACGCDQTSRRGATVHPAPDDLDDLVLCTPCDTPENLAAHMPAKEV